MDGTVSGPTPQYHNPWVDGKTEGWQEVRCGVEIKVLKAKLKGAKRDRM